MKSVHFAWNAVTKDGQGVDLPPGFVVTYKLYAALSTGNYTTPLVTTTETFCDAPMPTAGNYKACVTASGPDGDSAQSNQANFPSVPLVPAAPTGLTAA